MKEQLINLGCVPNKSLILKFPSLNIFQEKKLVYAFIRGYVDGDGCLTFSKNGKLNLSIVGTYDFLLGITNIFPNMFGKIYLLKNKKHDIYQI